MLLIILTICNLAFLLGVGYAFAYRLDYLTKVLKKRDRVIFHQVHLIRKTLRGVQDTAQHQKLVASRQQELWEKELKDYEDRMSARKITLPDGRKIDPDMLELADPTDLLDKRQWKPEHE